MFAHWPIVVFVAETLALQAAGLDSDGFDVEFTLDGGAHNKTGLKGDTGRQQLRICLDAAAADKTNNESSQTDMLTVFKHIVTTWRIKGQPPTTLLVLTDGVLKRITKALTKRSSTLQLTSQRQRVQANPRLAFNSSDSVKLGLTGFAIWTMD